ncbi:MAG: hypothetical protein K8T89_01140, partial [Planctomycetes bacterium]|nr:hypothetical protein [Planctomycetota bacterium]
MRDAWNLFQWAAAALALVLTGSANAADAPHPVVAGFERFYTTEKADLAQGGQLLLGELNCVSCHQPEGTPSKKQA